MQKSNTSSENGSGFVWYAAARATTAGLNQAFEVVCVAGYYAEATVKNIIERIRSISAPGRFKSTGQRRIALGGMNYRRDRTRPAGAFAWRAKD